MRWPLFTIDFEASGLGEFTYPIEIGIAWWHNPEDQIESWSTLIKPADAWRAHRIWNPSSEAVHGIQQEDLERGLPPADALRQANRIISSHVAYCDGGEHDLRWLLHLSHAAGLQPTFRLGAWSALAAALDAEQITRMTRWRDNQTIRHRARDDAELLLRSVAVGLDCQPGGFRTFKR